MALSQEVKDFITLIEQLGLHELYKLPIEQIRNVKRPTNNISTVVGSIINKTIPNQNNIIPIRIYIPEGKGNFPIVVYFQGGGFVWSNFDSHDENCRQLCKGTKAIVIAVDYRLAPENKFPTAINDCVVAIQWIAKNASLYKGNSSKIAVAGDSAGGYLALSATQKINKENNLKISAQVAIYPVTDHYSANTNSYTENATGYIVSANMMKWSWDMYLKDEREAEMASILRTADFKNSPITLIITAQYDPLRDEGKAYADKLKATGIPTTYTNYESIHGFFGKPWEEGKKSMQQVCDFLKEVFNVIHN